MKSVLLGGLKVWLVNDGGKPLSAPGGRAKFYRAGTSTPETVYSDIDLKQADAFGPVAYTDELGYLPAIWLKTDRLYKVQVEQKVPGSGNQWTLLWEVDNVGYIDPHESEEPGEYPVAVSSISALKKVDHSSHTSVMVLGYFAPGDWGGPSVFNWNPECTKTPEDGAYVLPSDQEQSTAGRWVQQFSGDLIDVRKFGALPDMTENSDVTAKVVNAVHYSQDNSTRTRPITVGFVAPGRYDFVGDFDFSQYTFTDLTDNSVYTIEWFIGTDVVLNSLANPMTGSTFTLSSSTICLADKELVDGPCSLAVQGGGKIKVDPVWWGSRLCVLSSCYVECRSLTTNHKKFTGCYVVSNGYMGGVIELTSMGFNESWLIDGYVYSNLTLDNVNYSVHDCKSGNSYIQIKNSQNDGEYGDLCGKSIGDVTLVSGNVSLENAVGNMTLSSSAYTSLKLKNVNGNVIVPYIPSSPPSIEMDSCNVSLQNGGPGIAYAYLFTLKAKCSYVDGSQVSCSGVDARDSTIKPGFTVIGDVSLVGCLMTGAFMQKNSGTINLTLNNCILTKYTIAGVQGDTPAVVNGSITGNHSSSANPIEIDRTYIDHVESHHSYTYSGNTGTFASERTKERRFTATVKYIDGSSATWQNSEGQDVLFRGKFSGDIYIGNRTTPFDYAEFFQVGTDRIKVNVKLTAYSYDFFSGNFGASYSDCPAAAYWLFGNNYAIYPLWDDDSLLPGSRSSTFPSVLFRGMHKLEFSDPTPSPYTESVGITYEKVL